MRFIYENKMSQKCKIGTCERPHFKNGCCYQHYTPPKNNNITKTSNIDYYPHHYHKACCDDGI